MEKSIKMRTEYEFYPGNVSIKEYNKIVLLIN